MGGGGGVRLAQRPGLPQRARRGAAPLQVLPAPYADGPRAHRRPGRGAGPYAARARLGLRGARRAPRRVGARVQVWRARGAAGRVVQRHARALRGADGWHEREPDDGPGRGRPPGAGLAQRSRLAECAAHRGGPRWADAAHRGGAGRGGRRLWGRLEPGRAVCGRAAFRRVHAPGGGRRHAVSGPRGGRLARGRDGRGLRSLRRDVAGAVPLRRRRGRGGAQDGQRDRMPSAAEPPAAPAVPQQCARSLRRDASTARRRLARRGRLLVAPRPRAPHRALPVRRGGRVT